MAKAKEISKERDGCMTEQKVVWVLTSEALRGALARASRGEDVSDIILDLWNARDPEKNRVNLSYEA